MSADGLAGAAKGLSFIKEARLSGPDGTAVIAEGVKQGFLTHQILDLGREVKRREDDYRAGRASLRELREAIARGQRPDQLFRERRVEAVERPAAARPEAPADARKPPRSSAAARTRERPQRPDNSAAGVPVASCLMTDKFATGRAYYDGVIRTAFLAAIALSARHIVLTRRSARHNRRKTGGRGRSESACRMAGARRRFGNAPVSPLQSIQRNNVKRLTVAWEWETGELEVASATSTTPRPGRFQATPVMLDDQLFLSTPMNRVIALDADTGQQIWTYDPHVDQMGDLPSDRSVLVHRGVAVWGGAEDRRVFLSPRWKLIALDAATGRPIPGFGTNGEVDLTKDLRWPVDRAHFHNTSPPAVFDDLVIVGSSISDIVTYKRDPPGDVQAFDVRTGRRVWRWEPIPGDGEFGSDTWEDGSSQVTGHANVWSTFTVDSERGLVYLPVSAASNDWYGGARKGDNLFSESLVCLDARTGRRVWHFQLVHHGLWDYDPAAAPTLVTVNVAKQPVDAVALPGKTGYLYAFDRVTGRPIWPIEERPVAASDVPNERAAATQPMPTWPRPFARQGFSMNDVVDFTPELRGMAVEKLRPYRLGPMFTPPSRQGTVVLPGQIGGAGWGAGSYDPESNLFFVKATNRPALARLVAPRHPWEQAEWVMEDENRANFVLDLSFPTRTGIVVVVCGTPGAFRS